jgi:hypothetical protein
MDFDKGDGNAQPGLRRSRPLVPRLSPEQKIGKRLLSLLIVVPSIGLALGGGVLAGAASRHHASATAAGVPLNADRLPSCC